MPSAGSSGPHISRESRRLARGGPGRALDVDVFAALRVAAGTVVMVSKSPMSGRLEQEADLHKMRTQVDPRESRYAQGSAVTLCIRKQVEATGVIHCPGGEPQVKLPAAGCG